MARRRNTGTELNFDGLTDAITNLVGSLVLLVVLVVGVTSPKKSGVERLPPPETTVGAKKPIDDLLQEIRVLKTEVNAVDQDIQRIELQLPEVARELDELQKMSAANAQ